MSAGFGLYFHWPFCAAKCPYCDFNSHVVRSVDTDVWRRAYLAEIARSAAETPGRVLTSVFFGGGTPSLMDPALVATVLGAVRAHWPVASDLEVTLEANPTSVEAARFAGYRAAGVNRVSVGVQALDDAALRRLGRLHTADEALAALDVARAAFDRVSFDLIYARQDQAPADWEDELARALALAPDHLSLYQLTIEPGTAFGDRYERGRLPGLPDEDRAADLYELTAELTEAAGLPAYEVSNHARPGAESRHNLTYWRSGDWIGIGPGAHGRLTLPEGRIATDAHRAPDRWLRAVRDDGSGESLRCPVPVEDQLAERVMMGLRLTEGISRLTDLPGGAAVLERSAPLIRNGWLIRDGDRLAATRAGRPVLDALLRALLA